MPFITELSTNLMGWYRNLDCGNVDFVQNGLNIIRKSGSKESRFHSLDNSNIIFLLLFKNRKDNLNISSTQYFTISQISQTLKTKPSWSFEIEPHIKRELYLLCILFLIHLYLDRSIMNFDI